MAAPCPSASPGTNSVAREILCEYKTRMVLNRIDAVVQDVHCPFTIRTARTVAINLLSIGQSEWPAFAYSVANFNGKPLGSGPAFNNTVFRWLSTCRGSPAAGSRGFCPTRTNTAGARFGQARLRYLQEWKIPANQQVHNLADRRSASATNLIIASVLRRNHSPCSEKKCIAATVRRQRERACARSVWRSFPDGTA